MMKEEKIIELSEEILDFLLNYKKSNPDFRFWLRNKNSISNTPRLQRGYWFQGTENYIFISFYAKGDRNNKTRSIGFVITLNDNLETNCYLEIVWGSQDNNSKDLVEFYLEVCNTLQIQVREQYAKRRKYYTRDPIASLRDCIENDKPVIDKLIIQHSLEKEFFITEERFTSMLDVTNAYRAVKGVVEPQDNVMNSSIDRRTPDSLRYAINEAEDGVIGVKELAKELTKVIANLGGIKRGNMFGIFGQWGIGKTYLMDRIWEELLNSRSGSFSRVDYHAWKYQDTPASWAYLYEEFSKAYFGVNLPKLKIFSKPVQLWRSIRLNLRRSGYTNLILFVVWLIVFIAGLTFSLKEGFSVELFRDKTALLAIFISCIFGLAFPGINYLRQIVSSINTKAKTLFDKYYNKPNMKGYLGVQAEIQGELKHLLQSWVKDFRNKRVILFVDDIDRCHEEQIIKIIDALRVLLEDDEIAKRIVIITAIDERILKRAIQSKYYDLIERDYSLKDLSTPANELHEKRVIAADLIREYMDKLFISGIKLCSLTLSERREVFAAFARSYVQSYMPADDRIDDTVEVEDDDNEILAETNSSQNPNISISEGSLKLEISKREFDTIESFLQLYPSATPRQIKILYYRYQLARNIFNIVFPENNVDMEVHCQNIILLLIEFSSGRTDLKALREQRESLDLDETTGNLRIMDVNYAMPTDYSLHLLKVIEAVVPY
jgi:hypothetical protein